MSLILDIILIAIILIEVISGIRRGFIKTVMSLVSILIALGCGYAFTPQLAAYYSEHIFLDKFAASIESALNKLLAGGAEALDLGKLLAEKPLALFEITDRYQTDVGTVEGYYQSGVAAGGENLTESVSLQIAEPLAVALANVLAFLTIFAAVILVLKLIGLLLDLIFTLPGLKFFNRLCGMLLGAACGLTYAFILAYIFTEAVPVLASIFPETVPADAASQSIVVGLLQQYNIFTLFF